MTNPRHFGKAYFENIWGSVHRHDYVDDICNRLEAKYGKCRVLDIGTGCGFLVKTLRERGFDAWGLEISEYAVANTCAPGFVLQGNVLDIPYKDDSFDVVFSNGLWEYLTEVEVPKGVSECRRVGTHQEHNIDVPPHSYKMKDFKTFEPWEWWQEKMKGPKVFVSCPTHECKEYAHQRWIDNVKQLDYPNFDVLVVDNSPTTACFERWKDQIPMKHVACPSEWDQSQRMAASMEVARQQFLAGDYQWWFNVEIDVIPDPSMLKTLIRYGRDSDWTAHCYPPRGGTDESNSGIGCTLWSRRLIEDYTFAGTGDVKGVDAYMWDWVRPQRKYKTMELWAYIKVDHLSN